MASTRRRVCSTLSISSCFLSQGGEQNEVPGARFCVTSKTKVEGFYVVRALFNCLRSSEVRGACAAREAHLGRGKPRQTSAGAWQRAHPRQEPRRRPTATARLEAMPPRRSPSLMEDLQTATVQRHRVIRARPTIAPRESMITPRVR